ncbi:MAG: hypothetical protein Q8M76_00215 [Spirochaetaceae bacterium]|nr:hypothetical protein [Spirochaetaceae bacterium]
MPKKGSVLIESLRSVAERSPTESLDDGVRYAVVAGLCLGDGGKKDPLARRRRMLYDVLSRYYFEKGFVLALAGDIEDLRDNWLKDVLAGWPELYAVFDAFAGRGALRRLVGEKDLSLLRVRSYPYDLVHALCLRRRDRKIIVLHGHQAMARFAGRDYLGDFLVRWGGGAMQLRPKDISENRTARFRTERRLYRAAASMRIVTVQGHSPRPLFESLSSRDILRAEVEMALRQNRPGFVDEMLRIYRKDIGIPSGRAAMPSGPRFDERGFASPCLFGPGSISGAKGLRVLEISGEAIAQVRWTTRAVVAADRARWALGASRAESLAGTPWFRVALRSTPLDSLFDRIDMLAPPAGVEEEAGI